jgi:diguanylate cyclase (GGDEF)-like protein
LIKRRADSNPIFWVAAGVIFTAEIGFADHYAGSAFGFSLFYVIPIIFVTWFVGKRYGLALSAVAIVTWLTVAALSGRAFIPLTVRDWDIPIHVVFYFLVALLLPSAKAIEHEMEWARIDYLTGAYNRRFFFEEIQKEINRSQRYKRPFTLAYIDLDNFKAINDRYGHRMGDKLLVAVVRRVKSILRKSDILSRLGGDEFMIFLPETSRTAAQNAVEKIQSVLLDEMRKSGWEVTFSIGVLTCNNVQVSPDELMKKADGVMYSVKNVGKNGIAYDVFEG